MFIYAGKKTQPSHTHGYNKTAIFIEEQLQLSEEVKHKPLFVIIDCID